MTDTLTAIEDIRIEMQSAAHEAADTYYNDVLGGTDWGACGFAWVEIRPVHKGNTRLGKAERKDLEALGAEKGWSGNSWMIWNPAKWGGQNVDALSAGATAAAGVLRHYGYTAYAMSRLD
jgi:hypothetical protein